MTTIESDDRGLLLACEVARQAGAMPAPAIRQFIEQGGQTE
jgi:hypothetical protein